MMLVVCLVWMCVRPDWAGDAGFVWTCCCGSCLIGLLALPLRMAGYSMRQLSFRDFQQHVLAVCMGRGTATKQQVAQHSHATSQLCLICVLWFTGRRGWALRLDVCWVRDCMGCGTLCEVLWSFVSVKQLGMMEQEIHIHGWWMAWLDALSVSTTSDCMEWGYQVLGLWV